MCASEEKSKKKITQQLVKGPITENKEKNKKIEQQGKNNKKKKTTTTESLANGATCKNTVQPINANA